MQPWYRHFYVVGFVSLLSLPPLQASASFAASELDAISPIEAMEARAFNHKVLPEEIVEVVVKTGLAPRGLPFGLVNLADDKGITVLMQVIAKGRELEPWLAHPKLQINYADTSGKTALHLLAESHAVDDYALRAAELLIRAGAQVNSYDAQRCSPLYYAVQHSIDGDFRLVDLLIKHGASLDPAGDFVHPLLGAAKIGYLSGSAKNLAYIWQKTSEKHAITPALLRDAGTRLFSNAQERHVALYVEEHDRNILQCFRFLHEPEAALGEGAPWLFLAVQGHYPKVVEYLLEGGASLDVKNAAGETPLMVAVQRVDVPMVRLLLGYHPNLLLLNQHGKTARNMSSWNILKKELKAAKPREKMSPQSPMVAKILDKGLKLVERQIGGHKGLAAGLRCLQQIGDAWDDETKHEGILKECSARYDELQNSSLETEEIAPFSAEEKASLRAGGISPALISMAEVSLNAPARCSMKRMGFELTAIFGGRLFASRLSCKTPLGGHFSLSGAGVQGTAGLQAALISDLPHKVLLPILKGRVYHMVQKNSFALLESYGVGATSLDKTSKHNNWSHTFAVGVGISGAVGKSHQALIRSTESYDFRYVMKALGRGK